MKTQNRQGFQEKNKSLTEQKQWQISVKQPKFKKLAKLKSIQQFCGVCCSSYDA